MKKKSRSRSSDKHKKKNKRSRSKERNYNNDYKKIILDNPLCHILKTEKCDFQINIIKDKIIPQCNESLGDYKLMIQTKSQIDPYYDKWDSIKFLLNDYELIDIYRNQQLSERRYTEAVIDYSKQGYIFSRAYFKIWEVIDTYKVLDKYKNQPIKICNLAEGPGGFLHSIIDFRNKDHQTIWKQDQYTAITLKMDKGDTQGNDWEFFRAKQYFGKLYGFKINLTYGLKGDGNMLDVENLKHFIKSELRNDKQDLITADGGIEIKGELFNIQELCCQKLFFSEIITALAVQKLGGTFILKIYDALYDVTFQMLQLLTIFYKSVKITKPLTSRPASSERYVVCEEFMGSQQNQIDLLFEVLDQWIQNEPNIINYLKNENKFQSILQFDAQMDISQIKESNTQCINALVKKINSGIELLQRQDLQQYKQKRILEQREIGISWCKKHRIPYKKYY